MASDNRAFFESLLSLQIMQNEMIFLQAKAVVGEIMSQHYERRLQIARMKSEMEWAIRLREQMLHVAD